MPRGRGKGSELWEWKELGEEKEKGGEVWLKSVPMGP